MHKLKSCYQRWFQCYQILPKTHRYTLGRRIDSVFVEAIEATVSAIFLSKEQKLSFVRLSQRKVDTLKILVTILWEAQSLDGKQYISLAEALVEIGRMLGGWAGQLEKQNSPAKSTGEK